MWTFPDSHNVIELADGWQDRLQQQIDQQKGDQMPHGVTLDNLAYIVYSSGTTGRPKGEQTLPNRTRWQWCLFIYNLCFQYSVQVDGVHVWSRVRSWRRLSNIWARVSLGRECNDNQQTSKTIGRMKERSINIKCPCMHVRCWFIFFIF